MRDGLTPARRLDVQGARNVRELGGYKTADGRTTRWRTFLRADSLHELPPGSQSALIDYGIRTVVDLRTSVEVEERPSVFSRSSEVAYRHHNVLGDEPLAGVGDTVETDTGSANIARDYTLWLDHLQPRFSGALAILAERGGAAGDVPLRRWEGPDRDHLRAASGASPASRRRRSRRTTPSQPGS